MSKTKTAVEWLIGQLAEKQNGNGSSVSMDDLFNQAKQMEKEQIVKSVNDTLLDANLYESFRSINNGEQYYTQTYESDNTQTYQAFKGELIKDKNGNLIPKK